MLDFLLNILIVLGIVIALSLLMVAIIGGLTVVIAIISKLVDIWKGGKRKP